MTEDNTRTVVAASSYRRFLLWCHENDRNPRDPRLVFIGEGPFAEQKIRGLDTFRLIYVGRPNLHQETRAVLQQYRLMGRILGEDPVD